MGYMRHHAIVVSSWNKPLLSEAHAYATSMFPAISEIVPSDINGYASFFVPPDGSKEGWPDSDLGDSRRSDFIAWLRTKAYEDGSTSLDWVEVQFADDDLVTKVTAHSDERDLALAALKAGEGGK